MNDLHLSYRPWFQHDSWFLEKGKSEHKAGGSNRDDLLRVLRDCNYMVSPTSFAPSSLFCPLPYAALLSASCLRSGIHEDFQVMTRMRESGRESAKCCIRSRFLFAVCTTMTATLSGYCSPQCYGRGGGAGTGCGRRMWHWPEFHVSPVCLAVSSIARNSIMSMANTQKQRENFCMFWGRTKSPRRARAGAVSASSCWTPLCDVTATWALSSAPMHR